MSSPFVAEIRMFAFNFPPTGWAFCAGQLLPISQNTALFSLLGTTYGGDGKSTFALPFLQGNSAMHPGQSAGGSQYFLGESGGETAHTITDAEMPIHNHQVTGDQGFGTTADPSGQVYMRGNYDDGMGHTGGVQVYAAAAPNTPLAAATAVGLTGGGLPHNNMMPYLTLNFCIALQGIYPARP
jgi:microcystin-dependent protein